MHLFILNAHLHLTQSPESNSRLTLSEGKELLSLYEKNYFEHAETYRIAVPNIATFFEQLKACFAYIEAAGAWITYEQKYLMIYRLGYWDLPKGKIDPGETPAETAVREIKEECGLDITLGKPLPSSYHLYQHKGKNVLKRTYWFEAKSETDKVEPQEEENIDEARWLTPEQVKAFMPQTYASIRHLLEGIDFEPK
ncbi:MAG: NUDIX domain-containing protein [Bernardetiaceae bacterium]|nr:NUDIX domain-containing protein [Bernardetiaceae bacterium]